MDSSQAFAVGDHSYLGTRDQIVSLLLDCIAEASDLRLEGTHVDLAAFKVRGVHGDEIHPHGRVTNLFFLKEQVARPHCGRRVYDEYESLGCIHWRQLDMPPEACLEVSSLSRSAVH